MKRKFYFILMGLCLTLVSMAQNPVVYLPMDTDLKDASGNQFDATSKGTLAVQFVTDAVRGKVAFFDTSAYASLPKTDSLRFGTKDFAFAVWVKMDRLHGDPAILGNKDWDSGRNKGFVFYNKNSDVAGAPNFTINFADGTTDQGGSNNRLYWEAFVNGAPEAIDGTWHFVAASFDRNDTLAVWVDGVQQASAVNLALCPGMGYDDTNDYPINIMEDGTGKYNKGSGLKGYIDDLRIWKRTITDAEVQAMYSPVTSVRDIQASTSNTMVYPNPSNGKVNINFTMNQKADARILVYNMNGAAVKGFAVSAIPGKNQASFNVNGWVPGIYLVRVLAGSTSETVRLMVTQ